MENGEERLADLLKGSEGVELSIKTGSDRASRMNDDDESPTVNLGESVSQWSISGNGRFFPCGRTIGKLQAGVYNPYATSEKIGLELISTSSDGIYTLPDMATATVLKEIETFWNNEQLYRNHNLLYKRGVILWGSPGSGKSITIKLLMSEIIRRDGIVIMVGHIGTTIESIKSFRKIEPKRNIILVYEDIDEIIRFNGEAQVLSLLDGEHNIDSVLNLASTNYPELLGARIINRPSRFDRRVFVDMPSAAAREEYLRQSTKDAIKDVPVWVKDTEGMSIAHLRELVAAVYCLNQDYTEVIDRLKNMAIRPKAKDDGFKRGNEISFSKVKHNTQNTLN